MLDLLDSPSTDRRLGKGIHYFFEAVQQRAGLHMSAPDVLDVCWSLVADGLVYVDFDQQSAPENWKWRLTERGTRAVRADREYEPDDPEGYLALLEDRLSGLDAGVTVYASEALHAYGARCFLASSVMLGVASERAFQLLAEAFLGTLAGREAEGLNTILSNPRQTFVAKFREFRKRLEPRRSLLPEELSDNLALTLDGVLDLLRVARNESGHPSGRYIDGRDAYVNLQLFGRYMERLEALRQHFIGSSVGA